MNFSTMDLAKLKVVELRAELAQRGLDTKGNKPVLVERLRKALDEQSADPKAASEATPRDTNEETADEAPQRAAGERTPEPVPPKTPGRSSRSTSAATPSKKEAHRGQPKTLLPALAEKQMTPAKTSPEKPTKTSPEKVEAVSTETAERSSPEKPERASSEIRPEKSSPEKQREAASPSRDDKITLEDAEKSAPMEAETPLAEEPKVEENLKDAAEEATATEASKTAEKAETDVAVAGETENKIDETTEISTDASEECAEPESEKSVVNEEEESKKTAPSDEKMVEEEEIHEEENVHEEEDNHEDEEKISAVDDSVTEKMNDELGEIDEVKEKPEVTENDEEAILEADIADEKSETPGIDEENRLLGDETMETNDSNDDKNEEPTERTEPTEPTEVKPEIKEDCSTVAETDCTRESTSDETFDEKPIVEVKSEIDEKPEVENAIKKEEEQEDVEMKEPKDEPQEDSEQDSKDRDRKDRKDRKRKRSSSPQEDRQKSPQPSYKDDEPDLKETEVVLSWYDSDLNLVINRESFLSATAMHHDGFGYIWAGARASYGFTTGKIYYEARITENCEINLPDETAPHVMRVGWSVQGTNMQLGEEPLTYGYGGTGKISTGNKFSDYGVGFGKDDVVGCFLDLTDERDFVVSYAINGKQMGPAFTVPKSSLDGKALFPHVLTKNCTFECNFGAEKSWSDEIPEDYVAVARVEPKNRVAGPRRPDKREDCEIIMMCGLPAAGKTVWATKYAIENPSKMYNVLGTNALIEKMKVVGLPRRRNYHGRWEVLINKCTRCLNKLLDMAATRRRNYILDQTNVYPSAQRRKMRNFYGYRRRAIVVVPTDEDFKERTLKRTACEGEVAPETAVMEMKANFGIPLVGESFDVVEWVELGEEEGKKLIEKYNREGKEAGYGQQQPAKRPRFESRDNHRESRDSRQSSRDSRDSRDHRDRRNNYSDRNRNSTWRGGSNSGGGGGGGGGGGWRDRQPRPAGGHARHGGGGGGGYGGQSSGGWRGRSVAGGTSSSYRPVNDRRTPGHDRRSSASDRNRSAPTRQGGWGPMNIYQSSQQSSGWGGSQSGSWSSSQSQGHGSWGGQQSWGQGQQSQQQQSQHQSQHQPQQQQQQQWSNWKGYGQGSYSQQSSYGQQGYGNGNWGSWNQQYYNQYWGQQQPTGQTSAAGSQAISATGSTTAGNSTTGTSSSYSSYSPAWQGYAQSYSFPSESSNTNAQQQK